MDQHNQGQVTQDNGHQQIGSSQFTNVPEHARYPGIGTGASMEELMARQQSAQALQRHFDKPVHLDSDEYHKSPTIHSSLDQTEKLVISLAELSIAFEERLSGILLAPKTAGADCSREAREPTTPPIITRIDGLNSQLQQSLQRLQGIVGRIAI